MGTKAFLIYLECMFAAVMLTYSPEDIDLTESIFFTPLFRAAVLGSLLGSITSCLLFPRETLRVTAAHALASLIGGTIIVPGICDMWGWKPLFGLLALVSYLVAMVFVSVAQKLKQQAGDKIAAKLEKVVEQFFGKTDG